MLDRNSTSWLFALLLVCCRGPEATGVASTPDRSEATQRTTASPPLRSTVEPAPAPTTTSLRLGVACGIEPGRSVSIGDAAPDPFVAPEASATFDRARAEALGVRLRRTEVDRKGRLMIALDHHPPRQPQGTRFEVRSLFTQWDRLAPGTHRLLAFWLDDNGFPLVSDNGSTIAAARFFHIEAEAPFPLAGWYLVAPAGTLNAKDAAEPQLAGHPFGLSLIGLRSGAESRVSLRVSTSSAVLETEVAAGNCSLSGFASGDYRFELSDGVGRTARTLTVNLDLGKRDAE